MATKTPSKSKGKKRNCSPSSTKGSHDATSPKWRPYCITRKPVGDPRRGLAVIKWIERHCVHTNDRWLGKPFRLLAWQKLVLLALFTTGADGLRVVRWAYISIAKKNGKTELAAALACYFAFGPSGPDGNPEPSALVICAAGSDYQADLVFGAAKTMCEQSPTLRQITETFEAEILCPSLPGSKIVRVAAAAKTGSSTLDGQNIYVVICDELHCWEGSKGRIVWEVLTNGVVTRLQPLVFQITTAGYDQDTICHEQYEYACLVANGEVEDPHYFPWIVEAAAKAKHTDLETIESSNPSYGIIVGAKFYIDQLTKKTEAVFRRYFLNQWTDTEETWLEDGIWDGANVGPFEFDPDQPIFGATDAATKHDSTANVVAQWHECDTACPRWNGTTRKLRLRARIWERPYDPQTRKPERGWRLPTNEVEEDIRSYHRSFDLLSWGYDAAHFHRSAAQLVLEGVTADDIPQGDSRMVPAAQTFFQMLMNGEIEQDGDIKFARHIRNAVAVQARGGNGAFRLAKGKQKRKKMDAAVAAAMAVLLATTVQPEEPPVEPNIRSLEDFLPGEDDD